MEDRDLCITKEHRGRERALAKEDSEHSMGLPQETQEGSISEQEPMLSNAA